MAVYKPQPGDLYCDASRVDGEYLLHRWAEATGWPG